MALLPPPPQLIQRARAGEAQAWQILLEPCLAPVLAWCARLGGPGVDAEDAAHDVLLVAWRRLKDLEDPSRFGAWLFGITRRVLAQHRRRAWLRRWVGPWSQEPKDPSPLPDARAHTALLCASVQRALEQLPSAQREVLVLCELEDRDIAEVAQLLDLPIGTVKSRLRLGRERLRTLAAAHGLVGVLPQEGS